MALNDAQQDEVYRVITERIPDVGSENGLDIGTALRRLLLIVRRSEARELLLATALEAVTTNLGETGVAIIAKVDEALAALAELDDDLPEGPEVPPTPTP